MSDIEEIADRTATGIALAYRSGEADPVEVTQCLLSRIEKSMDDRVFLEVVPEWALAEAKASAARYKAGRPLSPLDGVPVAGFPALGDTFTAADLGGWASLKTTVFDDGALYDRALTRAQSADGQTQ